MNYQEAVRYLLEIPKFSKKTSMENLRCILQRLGNPQDGMKIIHVAGTNGKGSVCAFLNAMLMQAGKRTGMFTSPHLVKMNERMRMDGKEVSDALFLKAFQKVKNLVDEMQKDGYVHPSFFEFLFLMALVCFQEEKAEYVILEVGLGGRLDATNVTGHPLLSVITSISLDHTEILGDTIEKIAAEKAGIIKEGVPVVYYDERPESTDVIAGIAKEKHAPQYPLKKEEIKIHKISQKQVDFSFYNRYDRYDHVKVGFPAPYQAVNASLAILAFQVLSRIEGIAPADIKEALTKAVWEGRMEEVRPQVFFDGAHNVSGITEFVNAVKNMDCAGEKILIFSAVIEKDYEHMIELLTRDGLWKKIYVVQMENKRAVKKEELEKLFRQYTDTEIVCVNHGVEAFEAASEEKTEEDMLFLAGSLYLVGELKGYLEVKND